MFAMMKGRNINRIPVVENGRLVGIVSRDDLLDALAFVPGKE
jgi:CBS domain-containing protein